MPHMFEKGSEIPRVPEGCMYNSKFDSDFHSSANWHKSLSKFSVTSPCRLPGKVYYAVLCNALQCSAGHSSAVQCCALKCCAVL